jgi:hypothetical protein
MVEKTLRPKPPRGKKTPRPTSKSVEDIVREAVHAEVATVVEIVRAGRVRWAPDAHFHSGFVLCNDEWYLVFGEKWRRLRLVEAEVAS